MSGAEPSVPVAARMAGPRAVVACAAALVALLSPACTSDGDAERGADATTSTESPADTGPEMTDVGPDDAGEAFAVVEIRPVVEISDAASAPDGALLDERGAAYQVGDPLPAGGIVGAEAFFGEAGGWSVALVLAEGSPGVDDLNEIAAECEALSATCPTGQVALVADGVVLTAPALIGGPFEADEIVIHGFDETEARRLAAALR